MFLIAWARLMLPLVQLSGGGSIFLPPPVHGAGAEAAGPWPMAWGCHNMQTVCVPQRKCSKCFFLVENL
jgi:hypothetical protein